MKPSLPLLLAAGLLVASAHLRAQTTITWTGSGLDELVTNGVNWTGGAYDGAGTQNLVFDSLVGSQQHIHFTTSAVNNFTLGADRPSYSFGGASAGAVLTLNGNMTVAAGDDVSFDPDLGLLLSDNAHTFDVAGGATYVFVDSPITGAGSNASLVKTGSGILKIENSATYAGGTQVKGAGHLYVYGGSLSHASADLLVGPANGDEASFHILNGGSVHNHTGTIANAAGSKGWAYVAGGDSTWTNTSYLYVGAAGQGFLSVTDGGSVGSPDISIGNNTGGLGAVSVSGAGSSISASNTIYVGSAGQGTLEAADGATVTSAIGSIGNNAGGYGVASIGSGASWTLSGSLLIGNATYGALDVTDGGTVSTGNATLGVLSGAMGALSVADSGSQFSTSGNLVIGNSSSGALMMIEEGGSVTTGGLAVLGQNSGSTGTAQVFGPTSRWTVGGDLYVGNAGSGQLFLIDGGKVSIGDGGGTIHLGHSPGGHGIIYVGYDGEGYGAGGIIDAANITTGESGTGSIYLGTSGTRQDPYYLTDNALTSGSPVALSGSLSLQAGAGFNVIRGANSYSGGTLVYGGTLRAESYGVLGTGAVTITGGELEIDGETYLPNTINVSGGRLTGNGIAEEAIIGFGGTLAPGSAPYPVNGLSFEDLTLNGGGTLEWNIQYGDGEFVHDLVSVFQDETLTINATPGDRFTLKVISLDFAGEPGALAGLQAGQPYSWLVFDTNGISGFTDGSNFTIDSSGFLSGAIVGEFGLTRSGNAIYLNFTPVPEPSAFALLALGAGIVWLRRRRA